MPKEKQLKIVSPKQMLQRLQIALARVQAGITSENLLNEINQTISKNSKTSEPHRLLRNLAVKIRLKKSDKYSALSNLSMYYIWKINLKYQFKPGMKKLKYMMDRILNLILNTILRMLLKIWKNYW